jgi:DNA-binding NarL/FixJ family response regulator
MTDEAFSGRRAPVLVLDDDNAGSLDGLAASAAIFGRGDLDLRYANDLDGLREMAQQLAALQAPALIVVDPDRSPEPKSLLAGAADLGFPLVVLSDGRDDAVQEHARSVGAAACLLSTVPARQLVAELAALVATAY